MKTKTIYVASDGARFDSEDEARGYEDLLAAVGRIMGKLNPAPDSLDFGNGKFAIDQDLWVVVGVREDLRVLTARFAPESLKRHVAEGSSVDGCAFVASNIGGPAGEALNAAWFRLQCIRGDKEYGQPYYAAHGLDRTGR